MIEPYYETELGKLYNGDVLDILKQLPDESVDLIVTSPPYWNLRDYQVEGQIGLEGTLEEYLEKLLRVTAELKRILKRSGVFFLNWGDCYQDKSLCMQNYRGILKMIDKQNWILRNVLIWYKPNHLPSSVKDRFTNTYEPVFFLTKNKKYYFDLNTIRKKHKKVSIERAMGGLSLSHKYANYSKNRGLNKPRPKIKHDLAIGRIGNFGYGDPLHNRPLHSLGKNPGDVFTISTQGFSGAHFAVFSEKLVEPMVLAGCPQFICKKCGIPRIVIKVPTEEYAKVLGKSWHSHKSDKILGQRIEKRHKISVLYHAIGWSNCDCNAGWEPGIVLDPFMGSGTVGLIAEKLGRKWIGIEINKEYCDIAVKRINPEASQIKMF